MAIQRRIVLDRYPVCKEYIMTRGKALTFPAEHFGEDLKDVHPSAGCAEKLDGLPTLL